MAEPPTYDDLLDRLHAAEETLASIQRGDADAIVVHGPDGLRVFTLEGAETFYRVLIEQMPEGAAAVQPDGRILYANSAFATLLGVPLADLLARDLSSFARASDSATVTDLLHTGRAGSRSIAFLHGDEHPVEVLLSVSPVAEHGSDTLCVVAVDQTARRRSEAAVRSAEERFRGAFDESPIGMALLDLDGTTQRANAALGTILGATADQLVGGRLSWIPDDAVRLVELLATGPTEHVVDRRAQRSADGAGWIAVQTSAIRGADGQPTGYMVQVQDISQRQLATERLRYVADHDGLTNLLNRRGFEAAMEEHLQGRRRGAVILLDVDHFKYINDSRGHHVGDLVLEALAAALRARLRETDVIARLGGDEFAILIPDGTRETASALAEELVAAARQVTLTELVGLRQLTISAGIAMVDGDGTTVGEQLALADLAMYDAKDAGRDRAAVYGTGDGDEGSATERRMTWLARIRTALDEGLLQLHAQPIVDLATGTTVQRELLVRLPNPDGTVAKAGDWFPVAERYELAATIDQWVFDAALELLARDPSTGLNLNMSAASIGRSGFLDHIRAGLDRSGIDPQLLTFEVTETAAISNMASAARLVEELHALGCRLALDDFGAGFGSFYYLKHLPFDDVKIDGEFVWNSVNDERDRSIITAMVSVAGAMGRRTVAESIEDEATLELMRRHGVDLAQGYWLGRPEPIS